MNFLNLPGKKSLYNTAKAVIFPVPFKGKGRTPGIEKGPEVILQASHMLFPYDAETDTDLNELALFTLDSMVCPEGSQEMLDELAGQGSSHFKKGKLVATLGGSYMISEGLVRAAMTRENSLSVLHLGAHPHHIDSVTGQQDTMARIKETCMISHIGIRSMSKAEKNKIHIDNLVFARDIYNNGLNAAVDALDVLGETVYLAINLDILDPAYMPTVVNPEPGGLDWYTLNNLIRMITREKTVIGFDVTGLVPQKQGLHAHVLAAKLVYKTLIYCLRSSR
ncbi:MAG: agmatinase [Desulfobulbus sp.]|nr:agmatinase [Desulfobulbus sp.]